MSRVTEMGSSPLMPESPHEEDRMNDGITAQQFHESQGVEEWRVVGDGACAFYRTGSFAESARLVQAIGDLPGVDDHRPDVGVRRGGVTVRLVTVARTGTGSVDATWTWPGRSPRWRAGKICPRTRP